MPIALTPERYQELLDAERQLHDLLPEYDKAEECGIDCQQLRALHQEQARRIEKMKQHYSPR